MKRLIESLSRTDDGVFIIDSDYRIIFWNQAAEEILGYTAKEAARLHCYEILGGWDEQGRIICQRFCRIAIQAERGDILPNQDIYARTHSGERRWLNMTTFAYPAGDKERTQLIVHLFRDVTEQKGYQSFVAQVLSATDRLRQDDDPGIMPFAPKEYQANILTARQWQVLKLLAQGLGTNEIAERLTISPSTVRNHVQTSWISWECTAVWKPSPTPINMA